MVGLRNSAFLFLPWSQFNPLFGAVSWLCSELFCPPLCTQVQLQTSPLCTEFRIVLMLSFLSWFSKKQRSSLFGWVAHRPDARVVKRHSVVLARECDFNGGIEVMFEMPKFSCLHESNRPDAARRIFYLALGLFDNWALLCLEFPYFVPYVFCS